jgi:hypothetical protein
VVCDRPSFQGTILLLSAPIWHFMCFSHSSLPYFIFVYCLWHGSRYVPLPFLINFVFVCRKKQRQLKARDCWPRPSGAFKTKSDMTKFKKDDVVRVHATRFNAPNGKKDTSPCTPLCVPSLYPYPRVRSSTARPVYAIRVSLRHKIFLLLLSNPCVIIGH